MPLWGWIIVLAVVSAIMIPVKLRILKKVTANKKNSYIDED